MLPVAQHPFIPSSVVSFELGSPLHVVLPGPVKHSGVNDVSSTTILESNSKRIIIINKHATISLLCYRSYSGKFSVNMISKNIFENPPRKALDNKFS